MTTAPTPASPPARATPGLRPVPADDPSLGELVGRLTAQTSQLVRDEIKLAQAELAQKGKRAGVGAGLFGGAGVFVVYALGCLVAAGVLGLHLVLPGWAAALVVAGVLLLLAVVVALVGKGQVAQAVPPVPQEAVASIKRDLAAVKR